MNIKGTQCKSGGNESKSMKGFTPTSLSSPYKIILFKECQSFIVTSYSFTSVFFASSFKVQIQLVLYTYIGLEVFS